MNKDLILYILYLIPLGWVVIFDQENLKYNRVFLKHLCISVVLIILGALPEIYEHKTPKSLSYFGSQMLFVFLMLHKVIQKVYKRMYKEEVEFTELTEKFSEKIANGILYFGMLALPFLIDHYIVQKLF